jgi:hypothetical protein
MLTTLLFAAALQAAPAPGDAAALMRRAVHGFFENSARLQDFSFERRTVRTEFEPGGSVKSRAVWTNTVDWVDGVRMSWTTRRDDKPLDDAERARIEKSLRNSAAEWKRKPPEERRKITEQGRSKQNKELEYLREFPEALVFQPLPGEVVDERPALVFAFSPRPGYSPRTMQGNVYRKVRGRIWIDREEGQFIRMEGEVFDDVSVGGFLAKIEKGTRFDFRQARLGAGQWFLAKQVVRVDARVLLVKSVHRQVESEYSGWRRAAALRGEE